MSSMHAMNFAFSLGGDASVVVAVRSKSYFCVLQIVSRLVGVSKTISDLFSSKSNVHVGRFTAGWLDNF